MDTIATTRMSSKGQVVIPETIRKRLNLTAGAQFVVVGEGDVVVLKLFQTQVWIPSRLLFRKPTNRPKQPG